MVLPCAMVPQIVLYGIEGREKAMTVIRVLQLEKKTTTIDWTVRKAEELR